jgi:hypothetical protein
VEVKGWGEPPLGTNGEFTYDADIKAEQHARACRDPHWRLEIVGNLAAFQAGCADTQRLTLTAADVLERPRPWRYKIGLTGSPLVSGCESARKDVRLSREAELALAGGQPLCRRAGEPLRGRNQSSAGTRSSGHWRDPQF